MSAALPRSARHRHGPAHDPERGWIQVNSGVTRAPLFAVILTACRQRRVARLPRVAFGDELLDRRARVRGSGLGVEHVRRHRAARPVRVSGGRGHIRRSAPVGRERPAPCRGRAADSPLRTANMSSGQIVARGPGAHRGSISAASGRASKNSAASHRAGSASWTRAAPTVTCSAGRGSANRHHALKVR
jgi:hypothetical protein